MLVREARSPSRQAPRASCFATIRNDSSSVTPTAMKQSLSWRSCASSRASARLAGFEPDGTAALVADVLTGAADCGATGRGRVAPGRMKSARMPPALSNVRTRTSNPLSNRPRGFLTARSTRPARWSEWTMKTSRGKSLSFGKARSYVVAPGPSRPTKKSADVYPPGFYASQAYWYASGHFPCGWRGKVPQGKLIVY